MMAVPLDAVSISDLSPSMPRVGMRYLMTLMLSPPLSDEHRQMQFSSSRHDVLVGQLGLLNLEGDVAVKLLEEPIADHRQKLLVALSFADSDL